MSCKLVDEPIFLLGLKHVSESPSCKSLYSPSCFIILDTANNPIDLKLKKALHVNKNRPNFDKQVHHF